MGWYDRNKRDLPWRRTKDPYAIFVSEMMLQQTQVRTVIPYYERFLKELPDWGSLARAGEDRVLKLWEGLGYYRRARNLQGAARMVLKDFKGTLPSSPEEIRRLPGVGAYSTGALLSIAHQLPYPLVDGNVIRVLSRVFLLRGDLKKGPGHKAVWALAARLVPPSRPGDFNQALMELGATVCLPDDPRCPLCPWRALCGAARKGLQGRYPAPPPAEKVLEVFMAALVVIRKGRFLVRKRTGEDRWLRGLWEFPSREGRTYEEALKGLEKSLGVKASRKVWVRIRHRITHHKVLLRFFLAKTPSGGKSPKRSRWVAPTELAALPFSSAHAKVRASILKDPKGVGLPKEGLTG